ncbi:MAG: TonB-dependent receptor, partial [Cyclobacteriaceae bacterium]|nr:TonB-dependent receptor [Cyclobacteriaceae bacterium]
MKWRITNRTFLLVIVFLISCLIYSTPIKAQDIKIEDTPVTESFFGFSLNMVLEKLSEEYRFQLDYDKNIFSKKPLQAITYRDKPLNLVLEGLLSDRGVHYKFIDNRILVIRPLDEPLEIVYEPTRNDFMLSGIVREKGTGESLPNAVVMLKGTDRGTATNVDGFFTLLDVPADTSTLIVRYLGYQTTEIKLNPELLTKQLVLEIQSISNQLDEVVITSSRESMINASEEISKISVSPAQLSKLPSLGEKDIFRSLQLLPGISGTNETSSGLYVRGGTPDQNLNLLDGFTVYHVDHFYGFFSAFNSNAIKDVQLYKGGFESK